MVQHSLTTYYDADITKENAMNEVLAAIKNRRSVRRYKPEQLKDDELLSILDAGLSAPSAVNQQSWHFTVIRNSGIIDSLAAKVKGLLHTHPDEHVRGFAKSEKFHVFYHAPAVVLVSLDTKALAPMADCSAAIQNMLLAAESLGIGSCWVGMASVYFTDTSHNAELGIPESFQPRYAVCLGYPAGEKGKAPARREGTVNYL